MLAKSTLMAEILVLTMPSHWQMINLCNSHRLQLNNYSAIM